MANKKLLDKILKNSVIAETSLLSESKIYNEETFVPTKIPALNLFLSGKFDGGVGSGHTALAGKPSSFKTMIGLILIKTYLDKFDDAVVILYDCEKGVNSSYFESLGIDSERVIVKPFAVLEKLKNDITITLDSFERGEHVLILIDSVSNAASLKELNDSLDDKDTVDMTRARVIKSIFRLITPASAFKDIPIISINHTYAQMSAQPSEDEVAGGGGVKFSATSILRISKLKNKDGGVFFKIKAGKSRWIKENSSFNLSIPDDGKLKKFSGLFDLAIEYGFISQSGAWYDVPCLNDYQDRKVRKKEIENSSEFWNKIFSETNFKEVVENSIKVSQDQSSLFNDIEEEYQDAINNSKEVFEDEN